MINATNYSQTPDTFLNNESVIDVDKAKEFRSKANHIQHEIEYFFNPPIKIKQTTTFREQTLADMQIQGAILLQIQAVLYQLADLWKTGKVPDILQSISAKTHIKSILTTKEYPTLKFHLKSLLVIRQYLHKKFRGHIDIIISKCWMFEDGYFALDLFYFQELLDIIREGRIILRKKGRSRPLVSALNLLSNDLKQINKFQELNILYPDDFILARSLILTYSTKGL